MRFLYFFILIYCLTTKVYAQPNAVKFEQIDSLQKTQKRNVIVFIHTNWCKYCEAMQNKTFKNNAVINLINDKFYFVDFDAQETQKIVFNDHLFNYQPNGTNSGIHDLAIALATINNQISYPTLCVLNHKNQIILQINQFLNAKNLANILEKL